ncbi:hypothetical protein KL905_000516 [Ogataea polymorpha]|nr:hypothetical protein KL908_001629 [Ogataea polymorpha]KAG7902239.1 hypothetical protein KL935_001147 [Ogataea polymorpha]KAG7911773.1 hypothetical protein KL906_001094 [Ogataea polymorpha]KAG7912391.1 hypothetical protein KL907_000593 [Ogataea polymorpha]KAG7924362.1 hypothetical protein KL905_000516 [Ogataea polymorpha]
MDPSVSLPYNEFNEVLTFGQFVPQHINATQPAHHEFILSGPTSTNAPQFRVNYQQGPRNTPSCFDLGQLESFHYGQNQTQGNYAFIPTESHHYPPLPTPPQSISNETPSFEKSTLLPTVDAFYTPSPHQVPVAGHPQLHTSVDVGIDGLLDHRAIPRIQSFSLATHSHQEALKKVRRRNTFPERSAISKEREELKLSRKNRCCVICKKVFNRPSGLKIHMYSHTGEKPFRCQWENCGKPFSVRSNLIRHHKIHLRKQEQRDKNYRQGTTDRVTRPEDDTSQYTSSIVE